MRYMLLIYSQEDDSTTPGELAATADKHRIILEETSRLGIFRASDPLASSSTATIVCMRDGKAMITDGPFAETKEQLAGYYILECQDLDEALEWAAKIPTCSQGRTGYIEVRPIRQIRKATGIRERTERNN